MQCGVETMNDCERSPGRTGLRVNFTEKGEVKERREKFLTAKYGSHQMSLIRKRLAVEMWLYDELQKLFDPPTEAIDVDIDEILDMDTDDIRRSHLFMMGVYHGHGYQGMGTNIWWKRCSLVVTEENHIKSQLA
uniref:Protein phosphatase 1 regulatory subunit 14B n=1 Tax=Anopheles culicifacies TaxID=139723 RepID=A0A182MC85_9DIPT